MTERYTAAQVRAALVNRYRAPEWATFFEVPNSTGGAAARSADAIAMSLYPSRGLRMHGFEIKVSRSDWLHELKQPDKSVPIQRFCDHWWIVTPAGIVKEGELPPTWGHLILKGNGFNCGVKAPHLERDPWEPAFIAALLRRAHDARERAIREGVDEAMASERAAIETKIASRVEQTLSVRRVANEDASRTLEQIKQACGLESERWLDGDGLGQAIGLVHQLGLTATYGGIRGAVEQARRFVEAVDRICPVDRAEEAA